MKKRTEPEPELDEEPVDDDEDSEGCCSDDVKSYATAEEWAADAAQFNERFCKPTPELAAMHEKNCAFIRANSICIVELNTINKLVIMLHLAAHEYGSQPFNVESLKELGSKYNAGLASVSSSALRSYLKNAAYGFRPWAQNDPTLRRHRLLPPNWTFENTYLVSPKGSRLFWLTVNGIERFKHIDIEKLAYGCAHHDTL